MVELTNEMVIDCIIIQKRRIQIKKYYDKNSYKYTQQNTETSDGSFQILTLHIL